MRRVLILLLLALSLSGWSQTIDTLVSYSYFEGSTNEAEGGHKIFATQYVETTFILNREANEIIIKDNVYYREDEYQILYMSSEGLDEIIQTVFRGVEYRFIFPYKGQSELMLCTVETDGTIKEYSMYQINQ